MTYVSHTVRSLRRDPIPGETIRLVVTLAEDKSENVTDDAEETDTPALAEEVESLGGEVLRELAFDRVLVEVEQTDIDAICSLDAAESVETDAVLGAT
ncbi:hypothetical protein [Halorussus lipolyticus]|uniref:hypothetical protein n=1 Tax=Halorussus lipolyticus TaxID=3034024 RepID=UPI0023E78685|nr:hypothetical protein [Halorussus sp. DT80]